MRLLWIQLVALLMLAACAKKNAYDMSYAEEPYAEESYSGEMDMDDEVQAPAASFGAVRRERRSAPSAVAPPAPPGAVGGQVAPEPEPDTPRPARMIAYEASTTLRVARIRPIVDAITDTIEGFGGFVERVDGGRLALRVPVARFSEALAAVQAHGDLVDERIFASDVTEAFQDVKLRLDTATATRERLVELLARSTDEQEKLMLIREIQRLTEQIDRMNAQATTLQRMADLSRINVQLLEREALAHQSGRDSAAFSWIRRLSPFGSDVVRAGRFVNVDVPEGMVGLKLWRDFVAEAPDGSRIWSGRLDTEVDSDAAFWADAVQERLGEDFASAERDSLGDFEVLTLTSRDDAAYTWVIAVRTDGRHLDLVEAYLTSPEQAERFLPAVREVIARAGGAS